MRELFLLFWPRKVFPLCRPKNFFFYFLAYRKVTCFGRILLGNFLPCQPGKFFLIIGLEKFFSRFWLRKVFPYYWPKKVFLYCLLRQFFLLVGIRKNDLFRGRLLHNFFSLLALGSFPSLLAQEKVSYFGAILLENFFSY